MLAVPMSNSTTIHLPLPFPFRLPFHLPLPCLPTRPLTASQATEKALTAAQVCVCVSSRQIFLRAKQKAAIIFYRRIGTLQVPASGMKPCHTAAHQRDDRSPPKHQQSACQGAVRSHAAAQVKWPGRPKLLVSVFIIPL